jgi:hypothetical protein
VNLDLVASTVALTVCVKLALPHQRTREVSCAVALACDHGGAGVQEDLKAALNRWRAPRREGRRIAIPRVRAPAARAAPPADGRTEYRHFGPKGTLILRCSQNLGPRVPLVVWECSLNMNAVIKMWSRFLEDCAPVFLWV